MELLIARCAGVEVHQATVVVTVPDDLATGIYALSVVADADDVIPELGGLDAPAANGRLATKTISVQPPL